METPDFLILGGGIIGCSLARELARVSRRVVVLDAGRVGGRASAAAAGLLSPALATAPAGALLDLCCDSAAIYPDWVAELQADGAGDAGYTRAGLLEAWTDPAVAEEQRQVAAGRARPGRRVEFLSPAEVRQREPALAADMAGGVLYPDDAQVDPAKLTRGVARVAALAGAIFRENEPVHRLVPVGDRIGTVHAGASCYHPGTVVLAAGAWSGLVAAPLHLHVPARPVKGQLLLAECRVAPVRGPLLAGEALFVPRNDGTLVLGVTIEEAGFDERATLAGVRLILDRAAAIVPAIGELTPLRAWAGLRPATPDALPLMGRLPPWHNLWVSTGHFRKGILLAPICARLMAQSILADHPVDDLDPFKPTRRMDGS
jgi:glycine oxidase